MSLDSIDPVVRQAASRVGETLNGKYRLVTLLGVGGMAAVYEGVHRNGNRVAVKLLHPELSRDETVRRRFLMEGYAANKVGHAGVVRALDDDVLPDGTVFLVLELLHGRPLGDLALADPPLEPAQVFDLVHQLLGVLQAAHDQGIVHRDLKPENLFVTTEGKLKVLDFGLARMQASLGGHATQSGQVFGTPAFMPPEQALGRIREVDAQSDLWAAGASAFYLLARRTVHEATTAGEYVVKTATEPAPPLGSLAPAVPESLCRVIDRALAFDKAARFPSAQAMASALEAAYREAYGRGLASDLRPIAVAEPVLSFQSVGGTTSTLIGADAPTRVARPPRPRRLGPAIAAGVGVGLVAAVALLLLLRRPSPEPDVEGLTSSGPSAAAELPTAKPTPASVAIPEPDAAAQPSATAPRKPPARPPRAGSSPKGNAFDRQ